MRKPVFKRYVVEDGCGTYEIRNDRGEFICETLRRTKKAQARVTALVAQANENAPVTDPRVFTADQILDLITNAIAPEGMSAETALDYLEEIEFDLGWRIVRLREKVKHRGKAVQNAI